MTIGTASSSQKYSCLENSMDLRREFYRQVCRRLLVAPDFIHDDVRLDGLGGIQETSNIADILEVILRVPVIRGKAQRITEIVFGGPQRLFEPLGVPGGRIGVRLDRL